MFLQALVQRARDLFSLREEGEEVEVAAEGKGDVIQMEAFFPIDFQ